MTPDSTNFELFLTHVSGKAGAEPPRRAGSNAEFLRSGRLFSVASGDVAEFRLQAEIAEAVLRTPSTAPSARGPDWVRLEVAEPTQMDLDRARAWFLSAWRAAEK